MKKLYIAYGSNMDEEQMAFRCPTATLVGTAIVEGYRDVVVAEYTLRL